jgi:hypothetical protein
MHDNSTDRNRDDLSSVRRLTRDLVGDVRWTCDVDQPTTPLALQSVSWAHQADRRFSVGRRAPRGQTLLSAQDAPRHAQDDETDLWIDSPKSL